MLAEEVAARENGSDTVNRFRLIISTSTTQVVGGGKSESARFRGSLGIKFKHKNLND